MTRKTVGIVGARGYTGRELLRLLEVHPDFEVAFVSSREYAGRRVCDMVEDVGLTLAFEELGPDDVAGRNVDAVVLALPNGLSGPYVAAIEAGSPHTVIVDLSGDHRFDDAWQYGLVELNRGRLERARRISNPGCYATGMQLAIAPIRPHLTAPPHVFGVSGYSGAGTKPSPKNDVELLRDNLMPYSLSGHLHEREVSRHLGGPVYFMPHVAPFFRGITLTVSMRVDGTRDAAGYRALYGEAYAGERLVRIVDEAPQVRDIAGRHHVEIGGVTVDEAGERLVVVATIDNLLKGAATQAMQNLNLALGSGELEGIETWLA